MARFYADEQFPFPVVEFLRSLGHDVLTVREAGNAGQRIPDDEVLAFAIERERAILTINRTNDRNWEQFAARIDEAVTAEEPLPGKLIRVVRPAI